MGMGVSQESVFPAVLASGVLDGTAGTPAISTLGLYNATTPVSSAKGVYSIVVNPQVRPSAAGVAANGNTVIKCGSVSQSVTAVVTSYTAATGVIVITLLTSDTKAASEGAVWFSVEQVRPNI